MKRGGPLARRTPLKAKRPLRREAEGEGRVRPEPHRKSLTRKSPPKKRRRSSSEFARIYGSKARVEWVKSLACGVPTCRGQDTENAHIETGGTGRKADANKIVPLCHAHHRLLHWWGIASFQRVTRTNLAALAENVEKAWQSHLNEESK